MRKWGYFVEEKIRGLPDAYASQMCPSRFMPLYQLVKVYQAAGDSAMVLLTAQKIIEKQVKIESSEIDNIKYEMDCLIKKMNKSIETKFSNIW